MFGIISFAVSSIAYSGVAVVLLFGRPKSERAGWVIAAAALSALWGGAGAILSIRGGDLEAVAGIIDAVHSFAWTAAILSFLAPSEEGAGLTYRRGLGIAAGASGLWVILSSSAIGSGVHVGLIVMSVIGLLSVEQVYRNAGTVQRRSFRLVGIAVGGVFIGDLFVFSHAVLIDGVVRELWESRGLVTALVSPLIIIGLRDNPEWERGLFVSRQAVFYTASLLGVGAYLLAMASIAVLLRALGGQWSSWYQLVFLATALLVLLAVLMSRMIKSRIRVALVKHFYRSEYDYRAEWLRLTDRLARAQDLPDLARSALTGLASIVGGCEGHLWITRDGKKYDWQLSLPEGAVPREQIYASDHPLVKFLERAGWVIDSDEYARSPEHYSNAFGPPGDGLLPAGSLVVPLDCQGSLLGFAVIRRPAGLGTLDFDDHDILKTAGKQVAAFIAQTIAQQQLTETREFEAMNRLSTFLMHDLKNLIAQQELVVRNAQRFGDRPDFIRDAIETIRSSVERMKAVVGQLRVGKLQSQIASRVDVARVLYEVRSRCADRLPVPTMTLSEEAVRVTMNRENLTSALIHLVRNAQDATRPEGRIDLRMKLDGDMLLLEIEDDGEGMRATFVRDHLFRPFHTTKGEEGMGIGVYQVRELVQAAGGQVKVSSEPGRGTTFTLTLPCEPVVRSQSRGLEAPDVP